MSVTVPPESARVLVVDDERAVADLYAAWLEDDHEIETAYDGETALEAIDERVDVVFLDRQMPGLSGDEVLDTIERRDLDCRVVMVTAIDPDFDIVDMPFDDYLTKPVTRADVVDTVDEMLTRQEYDDRMQQYFALASKKATLEAEKSRASLEASEEYETISRRVERLATEVDETVSELDDFESVFRDLPQHS